MGTENRLWAPHRFFFIFFGFGRSNLQKCALIAHICRALFPLSRCFLESSCFWQVSGPQSTVEIGIFGVFVSFPSWKHGHTSRNLFSMFGRFPFGNSPTPPNPSFLFLVCLFSGFVCLCLVFAFSWFRLLKESPHNVRPCPPQKILNNQIRTTYIRTLRETHTIFQTETTYLPSIVFGFVSGSLLPKTLSLFLFWFDVPFKNPNCPIQLNYGDKWRTMILPRPSLCVVFLVRFGGRISPYLAISHKQELHDKLKNWVKLHKVEIVAQVVVCVQQAQIVYLGLCVFEASWASYVWLAQEKGWNICLILCMFCLFSSFSPF